MQLQRINADWHEPVIVAASGPSLTKEVAWTCRKARWMNGWRIVAVNDAYKMFPALDILYACDAKWWKHHDGAKDCDAEKWSSHSNAIASNDDKREIARLYGVKTIIGQHKDTFSTDPGVIHYGSNSGFQAINVAVLKGATKIALVGFDMRRVDGRAHYFGEHPEGLIRCTDYAQFVPAFRRAARTAPVPIVNCTPGSALDCFPMADLGEVLTDSTDRREMRQEVSNAIHA